MDADLDFNLPFFTGRDVVIVQEFLNFNRAMKALFSFIQSRETFIFSNLFPKTPRELKRGRHTVLTLLSVACTGALSLIVSTLLMFPPLTVQCHVVFELHLLSFQVVTVAPTISRKSASRVIANGTTGRFVTDHLDYQ